MATVAVAAMVLTGATAVGQPGRPAATANWPLFHDNGAATGFNPNETVLGVSNVPSLVLRWRATEDYRKVLGYTPVVALGIAYVAGETGDSSSLYAFDAAGVTNCSGTPDRCTPLWIGMTSHGSGVVTSAPAVGSRFAYIVQDNGTVSAFRASGCGAATCTAIWTGSTDSSTLDASPVVVGGVLYIGSIAGSLYAFDAAGQTNCSGAPRVCAPLWTGQTGGPIEGSVAVSRGVVYVGSGDGDLYAFDAAGQTNCSGTPLVCAPLWTGTTGGPMQFGASPAVANGLVYVGSGDSSLYAFDAAGILNCSGDPKSCSPLWTAPTGGSITSTPAVAGGVLYVGSNDGNLYAFDALGQTNCSGTPKKCAPLWTGFTVTLNGLGSPAVANGVVYEQSSGSLFAFDAAGVTNCSGTPTTCTPLWSGSLFYSPFASAIVVNGFVYVGANYALKVFGLPG